MCIPTKLVRTQHLSFPIAILLLKAVLTDNEALESICRLLGLRSNKPTLGVQHEICLHHIRISTIVFPSFVRCENHATSHVDLDTKSHLRI